MRERTAARERAENKDIITYTSSSFSGHAIVRAYVPGRIRAHVCACGRRRCTDLNFAHVHCAASAYTLLYFAGIGDIFLRADDFSSYFLLQSRRLCGLLSSRSSGKRKVVHEQGLKFFEIRYAFVCELDPLSRQPFCPSIYFAQIYIRFNALLQSTKFLTSTLFTTVRCRCDSIRELSELSVAVVSHSRTYCWLYIKSPECVRL